MSLSRNIPVDSLAAAKQSSSYSRFPLLSVLRPRFSISSATTAPYQHVQITDLEPNTSYVYRVKSSDNPEAFSSRKFRTMPASGPFTFIVLSDAHAQDKRFKYVADAIAAQLVVGKFI